MRNAEARKRRGARLLTSIPRSKNVDHITPPQGTLIYIVQYSQVRNVGTFLASEHCLPSGQFHVGLSRQSVRDYPTQQLKVFTN